MRRAHINIRGSAVTTVTILPSPQQVLFESATAEVPRRNRVGALVVKACFDRITAATLLLALVPVFLVLGLLVRCSTPGPMLFRQTRVGRGGRLFTLWKFRSMHVGAEHLQPHLESHNDTDGLLFKMRADPRVTRVGRFLRRYSLDELPQLVNVLQGHMSLVGPRPPLPTEVERYVGQTHRRLLVKPGLTGLWQISGRSDLSWEQSVGLDLHYVEHWSLGLDLALMARTLSAVVRGRGAY
jgi:lipopolysaccharide/colanic/teichoic acid biosynthesis glycosyltransferase